MNSKATPDYIREDLELAQAIYNGLQAGDSTQFKKFICSNYDFFENFTQKRCNRYNLESEGIFHSFWIEVLCKGEIFRKYEGRNNSRLITFISKALKNFISTENRKRFERRVGEVPGLPGGEDAIQSGSDDIFINNIVKNKFKKFRLKKHLENRKLVFYVNYLLSYAITQGCEQINVSFYENILRVLIYRDGNEEEFSPISDIKQPRYVIPRIKSIFRIDPLQKISEDQSGQLILSTKGKKIFLTLTNLFDKNDQEGVKITLFDITHQNNDQLSQSFACQNIMASVDDDIDEYTDETETEECLDESQEKLNESLFDILFQDVNWGEDEDNQGMGAKKGVHGPPISKIDDRLENDAILKLIKEAMAIFADERPLDYKLIMLRMQDYQYNEIADELEEEYFKTKGGSIDEEISKIDLRKKMEDYWKHKYERRDGPSALSRFAIRFERLLVEKGLHLDSSLQLVEPIKDNPTVKELIDKALENLQQKEPKLARIMAVQLSLMKAAEIGMYFGTRDGRPLTEKKSLNEEMKELKKHIDKLLQERQEELTVIGGKAVLRKIA